MLMTLSDSPNSVRNGVCDVWKGGVLYLQLLPHFVFEDATDVVERALDSGFWHIDTAAGEHYVPMLIF